MTDSNRRIALITGSNKGIGLEIARQLGQQDFTVVLGARDPGRGERAAATLQGEGLDAHFVMLDVTKDSSITAAANTIADCFGQLNVLVNNAGALLDDVLPSQVSLAVLRDTFETNVFGAIRVTQAMLPLLRRSDAARIVNQGSGLGSLTYTSDPDNMLSGFHSLAYNASKAALHAVTVQFANELRAEGIKVNAANPGYVQTDMTRHQGPDTVQEGAAPAVRLATLAADGPTGGFYGAAGQLPW